MGATNSKVEEDKALQLCRERKKFVRKALDGRCSLAATHFTYIESLTIIGKALSRFVEPEVPMESSLYTSTNATPEPQTFIGKSLSQFSFSSTMSQHINPPGNLSPSPSPPSSSRYYTNHMKIRGSFSRKVEEKPVVAVIGSVTSSGTPRNIIDEHELEPEPEPEHEPETPFGGPESQPWDYFGLSHDGFSPHEVGELNQGVENYKDEKISEMGQESEDEFDEPSTDGLVRSFENVNRVADNVSGAGNGLHSMSSAESVASETEILNGDKFNSPQISPLKRKTSGFSNVGISQDEKIEVVKGHETKPVPKDFISSMREIENLFVKASECGREVPRMLEANKLHFRPIFPGKERGSFSSKFIKACLACGDDPSQVQEEPAQNDTKYLTWPRTTSSRGSSFRHDPSPNVNTSQSQNQNQEDINSNLFDNFYMNAGSHASTLDRLYAWEKKLYDEVKANEMIRKVYDQKRKLLRELESNEESNRRIDKTRAIVKDLHWRIGVAIHRIDSISRRIEDLRDKELHPQLEELIEGLRKMWETMHECHNSQLLIISSLQINSHNKISLQSDSHRQISIYLESELRTLSSSFTKWIGSQKAYVQSLNGWLHKCVPPQQSTKKKRRQQPLLRDYGPPIYVTLGIWLEKLETLPTKEVADSIKDLAAEIDHFIPQEKAQGKFASASLPWQKNVVKSDHHHHDPAGVNLLNDEFLEDRFDRLRLRLEGFLGQLSNFSGLSMEMFTGLQKAIQDRKAMYARVHSLS
ncbi:protein ALTERED PHOSPHATE STARVATION RESPONSE 1 [Lactuca sativa]|nr:protein ALTERED PHOSPHATE STARVATION RESPONSE 1 [Lactuca sativa]XP_023766643.1 protein ALTERED PHOSPHATE STARVATION RESPONSE 1 [Lactuca sativa]XP_023766648.1 protein ALTERED PHOSPHATE STARVATION RESPONSE 1 [Lactuca sativa]XP_023766663.1 protein ALTERED PHOSPHATE STARVATION RESPONSE 1 [Lactuca sativa]XP_042755056.1 protein ALTERED PHOSPHATE STARVATION RESPONSE 1 [Lactuca sativa]